MAYSCKFAIKRQKLKLKYRITIMEKQGNQNGIKREKQKLEKLNAI